MLSRSGIKASHEQDLSVGPVASGLGSNIVLEIKSCRFLRSCHHFLASLHPVQRQLAHVAVVEKGAHQIDHRTARKQAQWMNRQRFCLLAALRTVTSLDTAPVCKRGLDHHQHACRSEEHTSELQSLMRISYAVFCLKTTKHNNT